MPRFQDNAERSQIWMRAFFMGPTGSGKSRAALELASRIFDGQIPVTLLNTEGSGRAQLYADRYDYALADISEDGDFGPEHIVETIDECERRWPGRTLVLDSSTHEWQGKNGVLQQADRFGDWKVVRPKHNAFVERLLAYNGHVIVTCRAKMKYEVSEEEVPGRSRPRQVVTMLGVGPIQDDHLQYEFNLVGRFDLETHDVAFSGHVDPLVDRVANFGDEEQAAGIAATLTKWLSEGNPIEEPSKADPERVEELRKTLVAERNAGNARMTDDVIEDVFARARRQNRGFLAPEWVEEKLAEAQKRLADLERKREIKTKAKAEREPAAAT